MPELCFGVLIVMVVVWLAMILWLFGRLRTRHPQVFAELGSPSLFWNNSPRNNWLLLKFLFSSAWRELGDTAAARIILLMRVWLIVYFVLFICLFVMFATAKPH